MPYRATQDGWVMVESSEKTWSTGEGNGKSLQYSCLEKLINNMKRQTTPVFLSEEPHGHYEKTKRYDTGRRASRLEGVQYVTREEQRAITNSSRKNKVAGPKWK